VTARPWRRRVDCSMHVTPPPGKLGLPESTDVWLTLRASVRRRTEGDGELRCRCWGGATQRGMMAPCRVALLLRGVTKHCLAGIQSHCPDNVDNIQAVKKSSTDQCNSSRQRFLYIKYTALQCSTSIRTVGLSYVSNYFYYQIRSEFGRTVI